MPTLQQYSSGMAKASQAAGAPSSFDAIFGGDQAMLDRAMTAESNYMNSLSQADRMQFRQLAQQDMNSGFGGAMRKFVKPIVQIGALAGPALIGGLGAAGMLGGTSLGTAAGFGGAGAETALGGLAYGGANSGYIVPGMTDAAAQAAGYGAGSLGGGAAETMSLLGGMTGNQGYILPGMSNEAAMAAGFGGGSPLEMAQGLGGYALDGGGFAEGGADFFSAGGFPLGGGGGTSSLLGGPGGINGVMQNLSQILGKKGSMLDIMKMLSGAYGLAGAGSIGKQAKLPNPADIQGMPGYKAGMDAVMRSMAAQGYQGSGNMMAAMAKYGGDFYNQYVNQRINSAQAQQAPLTGQLSSLGLLAGGASNLFGG